MLNFEEPRNMSDEERIAEIASILNRGLSRVSRDSGTGALLHLQKEQKELAVADPHSMHAGGMAASNTGTHGHAFGNDAPDGRESTTSKENI